jgi:CheY-like chemotaxis protein
VAIGLTSQLLTFSRGGHPVRKLMAVRPVVESTARLALSGSHAQWRTEFDEDLWAVEADEARLAQVIQNLVLNADQAMGHTGTICVAARNVVAPGEGLPGALARGAYVAIAIRDTGAGIAPQDLTRIFEPYFTTKQQGNGLGLATSYSIVKSHGGLIDVSTELGRGSTFTVYLPATRSDPAAATQPGRAQTPRALRVLVMDDDDMVRSAVGSLLRALGHEPEYAADGEAALDLYRAAIAALRPFDVVIFDLTVRGGMGGIEAIARLRREDPNVRAIVSSGYSDEPAVASPTAYGFDVALQKPYALDALRAALLQLFP